MALPILDGNQTAATLSTVLTSGEHIPAHTVVSLGSQAITDVRSAVSGSVVSISNFPASQSTTFGAVTGSVSVLNFPSTQTIAGTVTANVPLVDATLASGVTLGVPVYLAGGRDGVVIDEINYINNIPAISGTVTANVNLISDQAGGNSPVVFGVPGADVNTIRTVIYSSANSSFGNDQGAPVDSENPLPISGTVTANNPSGALTTRFGSVTTANTAQITSAVTNTSRKYLLAQNISAGTVTIGIGFSPTTTQGIQLAAGGGLTFDAFCPTGAVYWLGAVTGAAFTILEG